MVLILSPKSSSHKLKSSQFSRPGSKGQLVTQFNLVEEDIRLSMITKLIIFLFRDCPEGHRHRLGGLLGPPPHRVALSVTTTLLHYRSSIDRWLQSLSEQEKRTPGALARIPPRPQGPRTGATVLQRQPHTITSPTSIGGTGQVHGHNPSHCNSFIC